MEQVACKYLLKRHHFLLKPQKLPNKKATSLYTKTKKPESSTRTPPASCTPHQEHLQYQNSETRSNILINKIQQKKKQTQNRIVITTPEKRAASTGKSMRAREWRLQMTWSTCSASPTADTASPTFSSSWASAFFLHSGLPRPPSSMLAVPKLRRRSSDNLRHRRSYVSLDVSIF